jgi:hypothetical protein
VNLTVVWKIAGSRKRERECVRHRLDARIEHSIWDPGRTGSYAVEIRAPRPFDGVAYLNHHGIGIKRHVATRPNRHLDCRCVRATGEKQDRK